MKIFNKKGVSEVITTVLLVLIAVVAVGIIAAFIIPNIRDMLKSSSSCFDLRDYALILDSSNTCYNSTSTRIMIQRGMTNLSIDGFAVSILTDSSSKRYDVKEGITSDIQMLNTAKDSVTGRYHLTNTTQLPQPGESRTYFFSIGNGKKVSLGIITGGKICEMENKGIPGCA